MQVCRLPIQRFPALILLLAAGVFGAQAQEPGSTIRFADSPFPPYTIGEEGDIDEQGIGPEIAREACRRMGVACTIELHPWQRVLRMLQTGDADAVPAVMEAPERDWYLTLTEPLVHTREIIFYNVTRLRRSHSVLPVRPNLTARCRVLRGHQADASR
jgi:polar amino acid transport system substrate-binding protein